MTVSSSPTAIDASNQADTSIIIAELKRVLGYGLPIAFDIETTGLDPRQQRLVTLAFKPPDKRPLILDARQAEVGVLATMLMPVFADPGVTLRGHNLLFDLHWMRTALGLNIRAVAQDTMLNELLILGIGSSEAVGRGLRVSLEETAARYGITVSKEERSWFIDLETREEEVCEEDGQCRTRYPWYEPLPEVQLAYIRQDVAVVNRIAQAQAPLIDELGLNGVAALESSVLPAVVGMRHYGIGVDRAIFEGVLAGVQSEADRIAGKLHEVLDVPILAARQQRYQPLAEAYRAWATGRDQAVEAASASWESLAMEPVDEPMLAALGELARDAKKKRKIKKGYDGPTWAEAKREALDRYYTDKGKLTPPPGLKDGVNLNSSKQIVDGLRGLGLSVTSADQKVLAPFATPADSLHAPDGIVDVGAVVQLYLDYTDQTAVLKRWGNGWLDENLSPIPCDDNSDSVCSLRWYPDWQQIGAGTGRFSSNFQQVNKRGPGAGLRRAFVPAPGYKFVIADYSNIELRVAADLSGDRFLLRAFESGLDLHTYTAEVMFGLMSNPEYVAAKSQGRAKQWADETEIVLNGKRLQNVHYRDSAKTINFMVLYGGGVGRLAVELHIQVQAARELKKLHYDTFHEVLDYLKGLGDAVTSKEARDTGIVWAKTRSGRRRRLNVPQLVVARDATPEEAKEAKEHWSGLMALVRRQLANTPVQGLSADITKSGMALWHERYESPKSRMLACVHDEYILEVVNEPGEIERAKDGLAECMLESMRYYLHHVSPGTVEPVVADWWRH